MNLDIFLKLLSSLVSVTELDAHGNAIGGIAMYLKQALEILARDPKSKEEINKMLAQTVCADAGTFESVGQFVAACLTGGQKVHAASAVQQFQRMVSQVAVQ